MTLKERFTKVMTFLSEEVEVSLEQITLEDGATILEANSFEPTEAVFIVGEEGNIPLPVGEYKLPDGKILVVTEEGVIDEIKEAVQEEVPSEEPEPTPGEVEAEELKTKLAELELELSTVKDELKVALESITAKDGELETKEVELSALELKLSEAPAANVINHSPTSLEVKLKHTVKGKETKFTKILDSISNK